MVQELDHPVAGRVKVLGNPVKMSATPPTMRRAAPGLGADTAAVLGELGYSAAEIDALKGTRVV